MTGARDTETKPSAYSGRGRPPRGAETATVALKVRMTRDEQQALREQADDAGMTIADFVRAAVTGPLPDDFTDEAFHGNRYIPGGSEYDLRVRMTVTERAAVFARAEALGLTASEMVRRLLFIYEEEIA